MSKKKPKETTSELFKTYTKEGGYKGTRQFFANWMIERVGLKSNEEEE